ncbi:MAG: DUF1826 domain-containing protein [Rhodobacteraceae bacterium]|nr:DUF1826 domain-containing protein [Paracoccaceae bacterium]
MGVGVATSADGLTAISHPGCAATIWNRTTMTGLQSWLEELEPAFLPSVRTVMKATHVRSAMSDLVRACSMPSCAERDMLVDDISTLADTFAKVMNVPYLRLRLDVISHNACRKFHIDAVDARLICTYRGTGTQYGISTDGQEPRKVFTVPTGAPMILRGTLWPNSPKSGLLHRSPPIEGSGETRLVLVLDPVADIAEHQREHMLH